MTRDARVGVIGGMFDPVHCGHVAAARGAQEALGLDRVSFVPSRQPPHRADLPKASGYHRFAMAALAAAAHATWEVSDIELERPRPSFTFDTLIEFGRGGYDPLEIFFVVGTDAFAEIATWSRYPTVLDLAHFVVVSRPGTTPESLRNRLPDLASRMTTPAHVDEATAPRVILLELATPDVSSTDIRERARTGRPVAGLVPDAVEAYITAHRLYRTESRSPKPTVGK